MKSASSPARRGRLQSEAGRHVARFIVAACPTPSENPATGSSRYLVGRSYRFNERD